jgi:hypothetical protein
MTQGAAYEQLPLTTRGRAPPAGADAGPDLLIFAKGIASGEHSLASGRRREWHVRVQTVHCPGLVVT